MYKLSITDYNIPFAAVKVYDKKESEVAVFTSAGAKVSNPNTDGNGECELYVAEVGSYIVKVNGSKFFANAGVEEDKAYNFAPLQGEDNGILGQYAFGYGSKTRWNKKNPPHADEQIDPVLFTAVGTYAGVTQTYEDIAGIIIDKAQGASASVTYGDKVFDIPAVPADSGLFQTGFVVFPEVPNAEEEFGLPQLAPWTGLRFFGDIFQVISAEKVEGGWGVIFGTTTDFSGELPPLFPSDPSDGIFTGVVVLDVTVEEGWQEEYGTTYAFGDHSVASGDFSTAIGNNSIASGDHSTAIGNNSVASGDGSVASGYHSTASGDFSTAIGFYNADDTTKIFIIGNGDSIRRKNIFTIDYNGKPDSAKIPSVNGGDLVVLGIVPPAARPAFAGQIYLDANNKKLYVAKDATSTTDWVAIN